MQIPKKTGFLLLLCIWLSTLVNFSQSRNALPIEFIYQDPRSDPNFCEYCEGHQLSLKEFLRRCDVVGNIEKEYAGQVLVEWVYYDSPRGQELAKKFNVMMIGLYTYATLIIDGRIKIEEKDVFTEEHLKHVIETYLASMHDVAVLSVSLNSRSVFIGEVIEVNITVRNKGNQPESFNVTILYADFIIGTFFVQLLDPDMDKVLTLYWNTAEVIAGNYSLNVYAHPVPGEKNTDDNFYQVGIVEVKTPDAFPSVRRDITIDSVVPSKWRINTQEQLNVTVEVRNAGTINESFNVNIFLNSNLIEEWAVTNLSPNDSFSRVFNLNTSGLLLGNYIIRVTAGPVEDEVSLIDNERALTITVITSSRANYMDFVTAVSLAFTFGFFETFSPCTIILLSFVLSYTMGESHQFRKRVFQVMAFTMGFVAATVFVFSAIVLGLVVLSLMLGIQHILMWVVSIFAILFGLSLIGFNVFKIFKIKIESNPLMRRLINKYVYTYIGIFMLGFLFYFLDPCLAPVFVAMMTTFSHAVLLEFLLPILLVFCLGVIIPFVGVGILAGSISKLARGAYRHKSKIRAVNGLILISYAVFLMATSII